MSDVEDRVCAIRLFIDGRRRLSHVLSRKEAKAFLITAEHLAEYLRKTYGL